MKALGGCDEDGSAAAGRPSAEIASANLVLISSFDGNALQNDAEMTTVANSVWWRRRNALKI